MEADGALINGQYRVVKRLGGGSFGDIFMGVAHNGEKVAIKFEKEGTRCPQLRHEYKVYRELQNCPYFGRVHYFGTHSSHSVLVMTLHGASLEDIFTKCGRRFSLKTVLQIGDHMLERIEVMHSQHLVHRDVKPANFVLGLGKSPSVYCIDFGLSTRYRHPRTLQHIPYRENRSLTGTPRYASINNHLGVEQSRRDDLESIGYILIYFLRGSLPWQGMKARNAKKKYRMILEKKQSTSIQQLCQGLPHHFATYINYVRKLDFKDSPNIPYLRGLFHELYRDKKYDTGSTLLWDWTMLKEKHGTGDDCQPFDDAQTAATAKVQDEKTMPQHEVPLDKGGVVSSPLAPEKNNKSGLQRGGDSPIERADGHQCETTNVQILPQVASSQEQSWLVTSSQKKKNSQPSFQGESQRQHLQGDKQLSSSDKRAEHKKTPSFHDVFNSSQIATIHEKNKDSMFPTSASQGLIAFGCTTPNISRGLVRNGSGTCRNGGWSMWNLRPTTSGGFWGSHKRGWTTRYVQHFYPRHESFLHNDICSSCCLPFPCSLLTTWKSRANPFAKTPKATNVLDSEAQRRHYSALENNDSSLAAKKRTALQKEYAMLQRPGKKEKDIEQPKNNTSAPLTRMTPRSSVK